MSFILAFLQIASFVHLDSTSLNAVNIVKGEICGI